MEKKFRFEGRDTRRGAFTNAEVIRPDGTTYPPDLCEESGSGRKWRSEWQDISGCLVLVTDFTNSGKDQSHYLLPERELSEAQRERLEEFCAEHGLSLPSA